MMKLSTMWRLHATLDRDGHSPIVDEIASRWRHDDERPTIWRSSANFVYTLPIDGRRCFLRLADADERTRPRIEAEIALLHWLDQQGIAVAVPIPSRAGSAVETVATASGTYHAVMFAGLEGDELESVSLDHAGFERWGAALGAVHAAIKGYNGDALAARPSWRDRMEQARPILPPDHAGLRREYDTVYHALTTLPADRETFGLIHYDFELDNLKWNGATVAALDWDDCTRMWYAADIAFALRDLYEPDPNLDDARLLAFVRGYRTHFALDPAMLAQVPLFMRFHDLVMYAWLVRSCDLDPTAAYPDWLRSLEHRFQARNQHYEQALDQQTAC